MFLYCLLSLINDQFLFRFTTYRLIFISLSSFTVIEYLFFSLFLYYIIKNAQFKKLILYSAIPFIILCIITFLYDKNNRFDSISASVEAILIIIFCIFYLYEQINKPEISFIYLSYTFWFTIGFLIYLSGTFFLFIQSPSFSDQTRDNFWAINLFCNILKNILFAIGFYIEKPKTQPNYF
jgi:hypothetical protein